MNGTFRLEGPARFDCETLIIGSGAGGSAVADVLTASGHDVLLLEDGPFVGDDDKPRNLAEAFGRTWRNGGLSAALGRIPIAYAEGRCVGGSTEINSAIIQRTPPELLNQWAQDFSISEFGATQLAPYYNRVDAELNVSPSRRPPGPSSEALRLGSEHKGWAVSQLVRAQKNCAGNNQCLLGCSAGAKQTMTRTFLPGALKRGLRLISECRVDNLIKRGNKVIGANAIARDHLGRSHRVYIRSREVFVCAGAIHTPALLRRSGFRYGIGNSLRMHPMVKVVAEFDEQVDAQLEQLPLYAVNEWMPERRLGGSIFSPGLMGAALASSWLTGESLMQRTRHCGIYYAQVRSRGRGRVRPLGRMAAEPFVRFDLTQGDRRQLSDGMADLLELLFAAGARRVAPCIRDQKPITSLDAISNIRDTGLPFGRINLSTIHLMSSCPPGEITGTATDSFGRLRGMANVILADASQIPDAPGTNPQATVIAMALRSAEAFVSGSSRERNARSQRFLEQPLNSG